MAGTSSRRALKFLEIRELKSRIKEYDQDLKDIEKTKSQVVSILNELKRENYGTNAFYRTRYIKASIVLKEKAIEFGYLVRLLDLEQILSVELKRLAFEKRDTLKVRQKAEKFLKAKKELLKKGK